jgi:hypothetical protein
MYLSPDPEEQKAIFMKFGLSRSADNEARKKGEEPKKWVFPLGFIKSKPEVHSRVSSRHILFNAHGNLQDGLHFLQMMKWGVLQYCVIRPTYVFSPKDEPYCYLILEQDNVSSRYS